VLYIVPVHPVQYAFLFAAFAFCGLSLQAAPPEKYIVHTRGFSHTYLRGPAVGPPENFIEGGVIHARAQRGVDLYLLISCTVPSGGNPNGECGAGEESSLYWLDIRGDTVVKAQEILYDSCWKNNMGSIVGWKGQFFTATFDTTLNTGPKTDDFSTITHLLVFDCKAPEKGIHQQDSAPVPFQPSAPN